MLLVSSPNLLTTESTEDTEERYGKRNEGQVEQEGAELAKGAKGGSRDVAVVVAILILGVWCLESFCCRCRQGSWFLAVLQVCFYGSVNCG
jgi:hypothetical protein